MVPGDVLNKAGDAELALHNTRDPVRSKAMPLSLGRAPKSPGELSKYTDARVSFP